MSENHQDLSVQSEGAIDYWRRLTELAREVLRDRGLTDGQIEAELNKPPGKPAADAKPS